MMNGGKFTFFFIFSILVCGCSEIPGKLLVMEGNFKNARGDYTGAISAYTKALEYNGAAPYSEFGLGSVYFALGEENAALERFSEAENMLKSFDPATSRELHYRIHYNTGVVLFTDGDFTGAVDSFREALRIDGGRKEAKRNLELSLRSLARKDVSGGGESAEESESLAALFEYVQQKEFNQWKSREWQKEEDTHGLDY